MKRVLLAVVVLLGTAAPARAAVWVTNDRTQITTKIGHKFVFHTRIRNRSGEPARGLLAHLNVADLTGHTYVDPEDWSSNRTRYLPPIPAHGAATLTWKLNAVNAGKIGVYVAVLPQSGAPTPPTTGPTVRVEISERRTLNSGGILPLALAIPALLALATLALRRRRAR